MTLLLPEFHLGTFAAALDAGDTDVLLRRYDPDAEIRVLHLDRARESLELVHGHREIGDWLIRTVRGCLTHRVVRVVDAGDHVTFHEERLRADGTWLLAMNMAEIHGGLISHQYCILGWDLPASYPLTAV
jgi:hypothetical protein